jgi:hypothetical protein
MAFVALNRSFIFSKRSLDRLLESGKTVARVSDYPAAA